MLDTQVLKFIQDWYFQNCDGVWEHNENISIKTIDNPGWRATIDLEGTECEGQSFQDMEHENSDIDWFHCFIRDGKFEGAGGPNNLIDIFKSFMEWVYKIRSSK